MAGTEILNGRESIGPRKRRTSFGIPSDPSRPIISLIKDSHSMVEKSKLPVSVMSTEEIQAALKSLDEDSQKLEPSKKEPVKKKRRSSLIDTCNIIEEVEPQEEVEEPCTSSSARRSTRLKRKSSINMTHNQTNPPIIQEETDPKIKAYMPEEMPSWLLEVYENKNYVEPNERPLETIYEANNNRIKRPISVLRSIDFESDKYLQKRVRREKTKVKRLGRKPITISAETESKFNEFLKSQDLNIP